MGDLSSGQNRVRILGGPHLPTWGLVSGEGTSEAPRQKTGTGSGGHPRKTPLSWACDRRQRAGHRPHAWRRGEE